MATQTWPASLPKSPLLEGYSKQRQDTKLRTTVEAGLDKVRNRYRAAPKFITESFHFTNAQKEAFETFHDDTCDGGAERFIRTDPENGVDSEYRFISEPDYNVIGFTADGAVWRVDLNLELMP